jgi:hypothetical protein
MSNPPPPPPHGEKHYKGGLPDGHYDIFIIPPHSSGGGFLYLPSLKPSPNAFIAGILSGILLTLTCQTVFPVLQAWFATVVASGGMGVVILLAGVGVAGWVWGKSQTEMGSQADGSAGSGGTGPPPTPPGGMPGTSYGPPPAADTRAPPKPTWQRTNPRPTNTGGFPNGTAGSGTSKAAWEKAREETRKKEDERRRADELRRKREEEEKEREIQREKEAKEAKERAEREAQEQKVKEEEARREKEAKDQKEKEAKERREKEEREAREAKERQVKEAKEAKERQEKEAKEAKERQEREAKERREREARERRIREARERREREEKEKAKVADIPSSSKPTFTRSPSPTKKPQQPSAATATDDDAHSFRPYDKAKRPVNKATSASSIYSESSYAPSQSTAKTTPPPSHRGPYRTKDPDKIVLKAVYSFNNTFPNLPVAQLISGNGLVTDGLILRITTEGLFIDDEVRSVPEREWDIKAWTLKLVEVWCPQLQDLGAKPGSARPAAAASRTAFFGSKSSLKVPTSEESDAFLDKLLLLCKSRCLAGSSASYRGSRSNVGTSQSGEYKGLHVLRASIRDQEGKRYVFVLQEEEGWKVAIGLQRLRRGTQVRALGVSGMTANETKAILESRGWT